MATLGNRSAHAHADACVVLGARVWAGGSPSDALLDRVLAGIELYDEGLCDTLVLSGGPGVDEWSEPRVMRRIALEHGVPESALILDETGLNTRASAQRVGTLAREHGWGSVIGVTHFYHTPRLKLALRREGLDAQTHAASQRGGPLRKLPVFMARESLAWWAYALGLR